VPCCVHLLVADVALVVRNTAFLGPHAGSDGKHTHTHTHTHTTVNYLCLLWEEKTYCNCTVQYIRKHIFFKS